MTGNAVSLSKKVRDNEEHVTSLIQWVKDNEGGALTFYRRSKVRKVFLKQWHNLFPKVDSWEVVGLSIVVEMI